MLVTAWNNGSHDESGSGYGLKVSNADRNHYFKREWGTVFLELEGYSTSVEVNIRKKSFWDGTCRELISKDIGIWLLQNRLAPWPKRRPPKVNYYRLKVGSLKGRMEFD